MALHNNALKPDPAYAKYGDMFVNRHKYFRWTRRSANITFAYVIAVPAILGYFAYTTDGKWDFRGKRKGDPLAEF
ncbi:MAG: hypothetical protein M1825_005762 [Sarcosagium campestre]|nr:MAG: hypothetical protein M1825_005762 [Sarcosagium campestre]